MKKEKPKKKRTKKSAAEAYALYRQGFRYYFTKDEEDILGKIPYNPAVHLTIEKVGSAMKALGFAKHRSNGRRGYRVVAYKLEEIEMNRHRLAYDATLEDDDDRVTRDT